MTIDFTEDELEWIDKVPFNWQIKEDCPESLRQSIEEKLKLLYPKESPTDLLMQHMKNQR